MSYTMVSEADTAEILGGRKVFRHDIRSSGDLMAEIAQGFPVGSLQSVVAYCTASAPAEAPKLRDMIVPVGTYKRRRTEKRLSAAESERVERIARVFATARHVLESEGMAREFLYTSHPELGGKRPIDVAITELGARQVEDILWGIFFAIPA